MKRLNERTGNGHPGYHNISGGGVGSSTNANDGDSAAVNHHQDSLAHFRRPSGNGSDLLLDLLHCSPQHQQQQAANLYQHQGYQLLSAPSSTHPAQYPHAYNHYGFPAFAAAMAAGGHCATQMPTTPESTHNPFSATTGPFNLQSIFSRGTNYSSPLTVGSSAIDGLASAALNDVTVGSLPPPIVGTDNVFGAVPADLKLRRNEKFDAAENNHNDDNRRTDMANVLHDALKKEAQRSIIKKPKAEPPSMDDLEHNDDGGGAGTTSGFGANNSSAPAPVRRRGGNGGRGPRGSGAHGCPYCPKKFVDNQEAETHQETCVRQRPFDCTHCGRRFRQKTSLVQHLRIHTDTRPYQCRFCVRNFKQKSHLDQHERIHTGAKPYLCKFCNKAFRQKSGQASHELTHANAMVQQFQLKREETDGQREELSEEEDDDVDEDEGENEAEDDEEDDEPIQLRVAEDEPTSHLRHHSSSLSTDDAVYDGGNRKPILRS